MAPTRYVTKSRFVLATECARKLVYDLDERYPNEMDDDDFLKALADGGHQVGALARLVYGGGTMIAERSREDQALRTAALLANRDVTIYEGAVIHDRLLVRCDILVKTDNHVKLIEVKSKSCEPGERFIKGTQRKPVIAAEWKPYLYDVTYQAYVLGLAYPHLTIHPCLLLVDKTVPVSISGLNSAFRIEMMGRSVTVTVDLNFDIAALAPSILREFDVAEAVALLRQKPIEVAGVAQTFEEFVGYLCSALEGPSTGQPTPMLNSLVSSQCKDCEFYLDPAEISGVRRSGWHQCMSERYSTHITVPRRDTFFGLYRSSGKQIDEFIGREPLAIAKMPESAFPHGADPYGYIDNRERQRLQWEEHQGAPEPHVLFNPLNDAICEWTWPLHFIDFETAAPALPYHQGRRPYEPILFQFSHHVLERDGRLRHQTQFLETTPGVTPSLSSLRALSRALSGDTGTVLHWWDHERNILKALRRQILQDDPPDSASLLAFISDLIDIPDEKEAKQASGIEGNGRNGDRLTPRMQDLGKLILRAVFYPGTGGSCSIKKILPAVLKGSAAIRTRYGAPIYGTEVPSLNFKDPAGFRWVVMDGGSPRDPYTLLQPLIVEGGVDASRVEEHQDAGDFVANGGAAMMAYDRLQRPSLSEPERLRLTTQLLRYCELDTLAMVMIFQSLTGIGV